MSSNKEFSHPDACIGDTSETYESQSKEPYNRPDENEGHCSSVPHEEDKEIQESEHSPIKSSEDVSSAMSSDLKDGGTEESEEVKEREYQDSDSVNTPVVVDDQSYAKYNENPAVGDQFPAVDNQAPPVDDQLIAAEKERSTQALEVGDQGIVVENQAPPVDDQLIAAEEERSTQALEVGDQGLVVKNQSPPADGQLIAAEEERSTQALEVEYQGPVVENQFPPADSQGPAADEEHELEYKSKIGNAESRKRSSPEVKVQQKDASYHLRIGIANTELNCYMSSVIQCLSRIPSLGSLWLSHSHNPGNGIVRELKSIMHDLRNPAIKCAYITQLKSALAQKYREYRAATDQDAMKLLSKLICELKTCYPADTERIFYSNMTSTYLCQECHDNFNIEEKLPILTLGIVQDGVDLDTCLRMYLNSWLKSQRDCCARCEVSDITVEKKVEHAPEILICHMYRHTREGYKIKDAVHPNAEISYGNFNYDLISLVCHWGTLTRGHFWAYVKDQVDWIEFNDTSVGKIDINRIDPASIYMLIYQRGTSI